MIWSQKILWAVRTSEHFFIYRIVMRLTDCSARVIGLRSVLLADEVTGKDNENKNRNCIT